MINHQEQFERLEGNFDTLKESYRLFKNSPGKRQRKEVEEDYKAFRIQADRFIVSIRNMVLREENK